MWRRRTTNLAAQHRGRPARRPATPHAPAARPASAARMHGIGQHIGLSMDLLARPLYTAHLLPHLSWAAATSLPCSGSKHEAPEKRRPCAACSVQCISRDAATTLSGCSSCAERQCLHKLLASRCMLSNMPMGGVQNWVDIVHDARNSVSRAQGWSCGQYAARLHPLGHCWPLARPSVSSRSRLCSLRGLRLAAAAGLAVGNGGSDGTRPSSISRFAAGTGMCRARAMQLGCHGAMHCPSRLSSHAKRRLAAVVVGSPLNPLVT